MTTSKGSIPAGNYELTVYAFDGYNFGDGSNEHADAKVTVPVTVRQ